MPYLKIDVDDLLEDPEALRVYGKYVRQLFSPVIY